MTHPFEVGKTYRNRQGEYVVLALDGDKMTIRYVGGGTLVTDVNIQARIWENIQFERQMARAEERRRQAQEARQKARQQVARPRRARASPAFAGFQESDFETGRRGVAWSSREELGKALTQELNRLTGESFSHWLVPHQALIQIALRGVYDRQAVERNAAFFVALGEEGVSYGFRVGKPDGPVQADWPWVALLSAVADQKVCRALWTAMAAHDLRLDLYTTEIQYGQVARLTVQGEGFQWQRQDADREVVRPMSLEEFADYLQTFAPERRCELYVRRQVPTAEAVKAGVEIVGEMVTLFQALLPVYHASIGR